MNRLAATPVKAWGGFANHASPAASRRQLRFMVPMRDVEIMEAFQELHKTRARGGNVP